MQALKNALDQQSADTRCYSFQVEKEEMGLDNRLSSKQMTSVRRLGRGSLRSGPNFSIFFAAHDDSWSPTWRGYKTSNISLELKPHVPLRDFVATAVGQICRIHCSLAVTVALRNEVDNRAPPVGRPLLRSIQQAQSLRRISNGQLTHSHTNFNYLPFKKDNVQRTA